ncbi:MAG: response regulator [Deltaproteobacteria bacterium]|nr:response regulator [Deltaproteobacteria bacterium]
MAEELKVMLLDDEPIVGQRLKSGLEKIGCGVEVYEDSVKALSRIKEKTFDIIITDVMMNEVNGLQILEAAKNSSPRTKVIVITGFATVPLAREAMERGAFDMIAKPFKPSDLRMLVVKAAQELGFTGITSEER